MSTFDKGNHRDNVPRKTVYNVNVAFGRPMMDFKPFANEFIA